MRRPWLALGCSATEKKLNSLGFWGLHIVVTLCVAHVHFFPTLFGFEMFVIKHFIWDPEIGSQIPSLLFFCSYMQAPYITVTLWRPVAETHTWQHTTRTTDILEPDGIWTSNPSKRARPQTRASDHAATGIVKLWNINTKHFIFFWTDLFRPVQYCVSKEPQPGLFSVGYSSQSIF
jgi:hypothetical protein